MKKILSILTVVMLFSISSLTVIFADIVPIQEETEISQTENNSITSGQCGDNAFWKFENRTLTIFGDGDMYNYTPPRNYISGEKGDFPAPWYELKPKYVEIENGITSIGANAFTDCEEMVYVYVPESVNNIASDAFLSSKRVSAGILGHPETINVAVICPENITAETFAINNLMHFIKEEVILVDDVLFSKDMKNLLFYDYRKPDIYYIIPEGTEKISSSAFDSYCMLSYVEISDSVKIIEENSFNGCGWLEYVYGSSKFGEKIANYKITDEKLNIKDGVLFNADFSFLIKYPPNKTENEYIIPDSVTKINDYAFFKCEYLKSVIMPDSVLSIGYSSFSGNPILENIKISNNLKKIENESFNNCDRLEIIDIPESVEIIGRGAFSNCENVLFIFIPDSVTQITEITYASTRDQVIIICNDNSYAAEYATENSIRFFNNIVNNDGIWFNEDETVLLKYSQNKEGTCYYVPNTVTDISNKAFCNNEYIEHIYLPENVKIIKYATFLDCKNLKSVRMRENIEIIENYVFAYCDNLSSVTILENVEKVGSEAFIDVKNVEINGYENSFIFEYAENKNLKFNSIGVNPPSEIVKLVELSKIISKKSEISDITAYMFDIDNNGSLNVYDFLILKRRLMD
ncbi:MAG: leucine-rich repeat domain-containing protein [Oscillospiraceae bacterium]|jgi:hypothetical protein|nr:leucine-rich repeat domain-containing protein [Oscillospiraceae bacterium]